MRKPIVNAVGWHGFGVIGAVASTALYLVILVFMKVVSVRLWIYVKRSKS